MVLEANAAHKMDIKGHKQDDPRASQIKDIAGGQKSPSSGSHTLVI